MPGPTVNSFSPTSQDTGVTVQKGPPLSDKAIEPKDPSIRDVMTEFGGTGTIIVGGILSNNDYNLDLTGTQRVILYDQMRKGDATVRAALLAVKLPILSANWYIKPAEDTDDAKKIAEFIDKQLFHSMEITWTDWLRHCLNFLDYGSMVFEKVFRLNEDGTIGWEKFAPRLTNTIYRWRMLDNVTKGITQILPTGGMRQIPDWKLMMFVNEQEGENYEGISILRSAYKSWYMKDALYKIDGMATERQGLGVPYVKVPPNANDQDRAKVEELMRNLRANEQANITVPVGWEIGFMDMHATNIKDAKDMILHHDRQITKSVLAQFLELGGSNSSGSRAVSQPHQELFLLSEKAIATKVKDMVNIKAIKELVDLNFNTDKYPTLEHSDIGDVDITALSTALTSLSASGLVTATPAVEQYLRSVLGLPEEDPEELEKIKLEKQAQEVEKQKQLNAVNPPSPFGGGGNKPQPNKKASEIVSEDMLQFREEIRGILHARNVKGY